MENKRFKFLTLKGVLIYAILFIISFQTILGNSNPSYLSRRTHVLEKIDLNSAIPSVSTEGFSSFLEWINAYENLSDVYSEKLCIAFTYKGDVIHSVEFKIPKKEVLIDPAQMQEVADYVAHLVLFGMAFIGGDGVVANWSEELKGLVENIFQQFTIVDKENSPLYINYSGMVHFLEATYGQKYEFKISTQKEIEEKPTIRMGFLMEVDKAIINMNSKASSFAVPGAGPYGLPGVIEQYTPNQRGIYNLFRNLVETDEVFRNELDEKGLMPKLNPIGDKQMMRDVLLKTQELLESDRLSLKNRLKIRRIYEEMGKGLGVTIAIAQKFMKIDNVMITGQAIEGESGRIIKDTAEEITQGRVRIWLPGENPLTEIEGENALLQFKIDQSKLSSFGQAVAMAAEASKKIYGDEERTKGKVVGIDCGSSDVKVVFSDNGKIVFAKKYRWDSSKIKDDSKIGHREIIDVVIDLARLKVSLENLPGDGQIEILKRRVLSLEESDGREYKTETERYNAIMDVLNDARMRGVGLANIEGFGLSFAGAVLKDRIVGRGSIVSGLSDEGFSMRVMPLAVLISKDYNRIPFFLVNDGDASAIMAGLMGLKNVVALAFGTSTGGGYYGSEF